MEVLQQATLSFLDSSGSSVGTLHIYCSKPGGIVRIPSEECELFGEESIQLLESGVYEYSLECGTKAALHTRVGDVLIFPSSNPRLSNCGRLETRGYIGRLPLFLGLAHSSEESFGSLTVEVRSLKLGYRDDIRQMLGDIADEVVALALDHKSPTELRIRPDPTKTASSLYQRYALISGLLRSSPFQAALNHIVLHPNSSLRSELHMISANRVTQLDRNALRKITAGATRTPLSKTHPLSARLPSLPSHVPTIRRSVDQDTQENQFVRFVLEQFSTFIAQVKQGVSGDTTEEGRRLHLEASALLKKLAGYLSHPVFAGVSQLRRIPFDSPALQRGEGYREVLQAWMKFDVSATLTWHGADDVFGAGQQNTAVLYEYWVFFKLLTLMARLCGIPKPEAAKIFKSTTNGLSLNLQRGRNLALSGQVNVSGVGLKVRFDYNRTFKWSANVQNPSTWTRTLRPDYTISVWQDNKSERQAEEDGSIAHLHFDAKYRLEEFDSVFGAEDEVETEETFSRDTLTPAPRIAKSTPKVSDLLKMHAYRDAIRRSVGAFVLYPGTESVRWSEYHELLPGVGAFVVRPSSENQVLAQFLTDFLTHYASNSSQQRVSMFTSSTYGPVQSLATRSNSLPPLCDN